MPPPPPPQGIIS